MWSKRWLRTVIGMTRKPRILDFWRRVLTITVLNGIVSCDGAAQTITSTSSVSTSTTVIDLLDRAVAVFGQSSDHAAALFDWAPVDTSVVVLP